MKCSFKTKGIKREEEVYQTEINTNIVHINPYIKSVIFLSVLFIFILSHFK